MCMIALVCIIALRFCLKGGVPSNEKEIIVWGISFPLRNSIDLGVVDSAAAYSVDWLYCRAATSRAQTFIQTRSNVAPRSVNQD